MLQSNLFDFITRRCETCGREFLLTHGAENWPYKMQHKKFANAGGKRKTVYYCSRKCMIKGHGMKEGKQ